MHSPRESRQQQSEDIWRASDATDMDFASFTYGLRPTLSHSSSNTKTMPALCAFTFRKSVANLGITVRVFSTCVLNELLINTPHKPSTRPASLASKVVPEKLANSVHVTIGRHRWRIGWQLFSIGLRALCWFRGRARSWFRHRARLHIPQEFLRNSVNSFLFGL